MAINSFLLRVTLVMTISVALAGVARADPSANEVLVRTAMTELFVNRDATAPARYWGEHYIQHNQPSAMVATSYRQS